MPADELRSLKNLTHQQRTFHCTTTTTITTTTTNYYNYYYYHHHYYRYYHYYDHHYYYFCLTAVSNRMEMVQITSMRTLASSP